MIGFKKSLISSGFLSGFSDIHTHLLWGVDDGVKTVDESLEALRYYELQGVKKVWFTPHIMEDFPQNTNDFLIQRFNEMRLAYHGSIQIALAAEYMLDAGFYEHLNRGALLTLRGNKILVETSLVNAPAMFENILYDIRVKGYEIILAHPERYTYMTVNDYHKLKQQNTYLQLNILSLVGIYGNTAKDKAKELLYSGMYDFVGSDIHHPDFHAKQYEHKGFTSRDIRELQKIRNLI